MADAMIGIDIPVRKQTRLYRWGLSPGRHLRTWKSSVATVLAILSTGGAWFYFRQRCLPRFQTVRSRVLYRSGQPRGPGLLALRLLGIRSSVNLRAPQSEGLERERLYSERNGIHFYNIPAGGTPKRISVSVDRFLAVVDDRTNWPILVHCSRGKERSGVFSAVFRMEYEGWSNRDALAEMHDLGVEPGSMPAVEAYVSTYRPRRLRSTVSDRTEAPASLRHEAPVVWQE